MLYAVIMAGGTGTRFWPKSTRNMPKQFLNLFGYETMIQSTVHRMNGWIDIQHCMVVTNDNYVDIVKDQLPGIDDQMIIGEKVAKNTAPCIAAAAALLHDKDPDSVMVVLPADHHITQPEKFREILKRAVKKAKDDHCLVTIGIEPTHPETGYGYINYEPSGLQNEHSGKVFKVKRFTEKPDREKAEEFIQSGNYLWNSGMFVWRTSAILDAFKLCLPEVYSLAQKITGEGEVKSNLDSFYEECPSVSVDYGIMEKSDDVYVIPGKFGWNDVGSWSAVYELSDKDPDENALKADPVFLKNASGNLIQSESGKFIAAIGVDNLAIVETDKAILVCPLDEAQKVKEVVEYLGGHADLKKYR